MYESSTSNRIAFNFFIINITNHSFFFTPAKESVDERIDKMCIECLVRVDSHSAHDGIPQRNLNALTKDEAMEFAPVGTYPNTGIDAIIVGTGFGGLTAAMEFTRKGHHVKILERNAAPDSSGKSNRKSHQLPSLTFSPR